MKHPMHLILDSYSHPGISMFWKRHGLGIMEQLVPTEFYFTDSDTPLEKLIEREIWSGWKKIILIGTPNSIRRGFNTIMLASQECRSTLEVGFWPLDIQNISKHLIKSSINLRPVLQVFKAGHTIHVDVPKVQFLAPKLETRFFWIDFVIKSTQTAAETTIFVDGQNSNLSGKFTSRIVFHEEPLNSLTIHPGRLTRTPVLKVFLKKGISLTTKEELYRIKDWLSNNKTKTEMETLLKTGKQIEVQGNWANLSLNIPVIKDTVQSIHFEVERKSLPLIIPAKPILKNETSRKIIPAFRPSGVISQHRET